MNDSQCFVVRGWLVRVISIAGLGCVLTSWLPFAQEREETPVPLSAEPSHRQVLANANVRVFRTEVAPRAATRLHQHANGFVWIALGDAEIVDAGRGASDEFLHPQSGGRNLCSQVLREVSLDCPASGSSSGPRRKGQSMVPQFETDQTRISLLTLGPKAKFTIKDSQSPPVLVALEGTDAEALVEIKVPGGAVGKGKRPLRSGDGLEIPTGIALELRDTGSGPARFVVLEFKTK